MNSIVVRRDDFSLDSFGVLRRGDFWVVLPPLEAKVLARLLASAGEVVTTADLCQAVWPGRQIAPNRRPLSVLVFRLRRRIESVELTITTIRSHGFLLHLSSGG